MSRWRFCCCSASPRPGSPKTVTANRPSACTFKSRNSRSRRPLRGHRGPAYASRTTAEAVSGPARPGEGAGAGAGGGGQLEKEPARRQPDLLLERSRIAEKRRRTCIKAPLAAVLLLGWSSALLEAAEGGRAVPPRTGHAETRPSRPAPPIVE